MTLLQWPLMSAGHAGRIACHPCIDATDSISGNSLKVQSSMSTKAEGLRPCNSPARNENPAACPSRPFCQQAHCRQQCGGTWRALSRPHCRIHMAGGRGPPKGVLHASRMSTRHCSAINLDSHEYLQGESVFGQNEGENHEIQIDCMSCQVRIACVREAMCAVAR